MTNTSRKSVVLGSLALILFIAAVVASGCTDAPPETVNQAGTPPGTLQENPAAAGTTRAAATVSVHATTVQHTPVPDASKPYLAFDPIGEKTIGDLLIFSGTTNLPEKTAVYLYRSFGSMGEEKLVSDREVFAGPDGVNRWRFVSDSSAFDPGTYSMTVATGKKDVKGSAQFTLSGTSLRPASVIYYSGTKNSVSGTPAITVNPVASHKQGDVFLITGTSSLEEGTLLLCDIHPVYFDDPSKRPATAYNGPTGSATDALVIRGTGGLNRWSLALDTRAFEKTDYVVNVSTVSEDFTTREIFGSTRFTLS